jgi:hypothetical protein
VQHAESAVGVYVVPKEARKPLTTKQVKVDFPDRSKFRNLKQYKDMTDEEFEQYWESKEEAENLVIGLSSEDFEERIQQKMAEFGEDYDLSDMKFNDKETLRGLCQSLIQLEDLEQVSYQIRNSDLGISLNNLTLLDKIAQQMSRTRLDMLKMQEDLKISRKTRQSDKDLTAISELDRLKEQAKKFYDQKMIWIFCPKCNMLLTTAWLLFPDTDNIIRLHCQRDLGEESGEKCDNVFDVKFSEIYKQGSNKPELMPESLR